MWSNRARGVACVAVCLALAGCGSSGRTESSERAIESMASTRDGVNKARDVVAETQRALDQPPIFQAAQHASTDAGGRQR